MVECLTWDSGCGLSITGVTALCTWARHINPSLELVQPRKTHPYITERLLMGHKEPNQTKAPHQNLLLRNNINPLAANGNYQLYHLKNVSVANSVNPDQTAPLRAIWLGFTLFVCMPKLVLNVSIYMQQTTFQMHFFRNRLRVSCRLMICISFPAVTEY